jgi:outer membrane protein insertion porin family
MLKRTLFAFTSLILSVTAFAQQPATSQPAAKDTVKASIPNIYYSQNPREYEIAGIKISGSSMYEDYVLVGFSGLTVGQKVKVPGDELTGALKRFWKQGFFSDVKVLASKIEGNKVWIEIVVQEVVH